MRDADVSRGDAVLEVGTGTGILTTALADRALSVVSCDLDARLQEITRGLRDWPPSVRFLTADVLASKHELNPEVIEAWRAGGGRLRLIANLPYSIATPLLANLLWSGIDFFDAVVLVQKEAAERFVAPPRTAAYGPMSVAVRLLADASIRRQVPPQVFWPAPKVQSVVFRLAPRAPERALALREAGLPVLLQEAFQHRRKTLRKRFGEKRLESAGIDPGCRPEEVTPVWAPVTDSGRLRSSTGP